MVYVNNLGTGYLFLNSYEDAVELFEKRGNTYSDRHKTIMLELWVLLLMRKVNTKCNPGTRQRRLARLVYVGHAIRRQASQG